VTCSVEQSKVDATLKQSLIPGAMSMKDAKASGIKGSSKTRVVCRQAMESHRGSEGRGGEAYCLLSRQNSDIANRIRLTREGEFTLQVFWRKRISDQHS
jgi:hypothetical protein